MLIKLKLKFQLMKYDRKMMLEMSFINLLYVLKFLVLSLYKYQIGLNILEQNFIVEKILQNFINRLEFRVFD